MAGSKRYPKSTAGLANRQSNHLDQLAQHHIDADLVAINLYPFEKVASREDSDELKLRISILVVQPYSRCRKEPADVTVMTDPADYERLGGLKAQSGTTLSFRRLLALKAFGQTARYDQLINETLNFVCLRLTPAAEELRYGENPHQKHGSFTRSKYDSSHRLYLFN